MILMIDNYDSFTYNLVQYLGELGENIVVKRNDEVSVKDIRRLNPKRIVISPGPGAPKDAGISKTVIQEFGKTVPILGVCLGHQCLAEVYGGKVVLADRIMHGKTSEINHKAHKIFEGIADPFVATRYHSLIVERKSLPACLEIIAQTDEGEIMGLAHKEFPVVGVQFHPESILTESGKQMMKNFLGS
jgi:anthranilate synthase/aminodeoxychorismate synthase-like glutamine amidotransferase